MGLICGKPLAVKDSRERPTTSSKRHSEVKIPRLNSLKGEREEVTVVGHPVSRRIPDATVAEQVAAGWPDWLSAAAPEATNGWIPRRFDSFQKLDEIGKGAYGCVSKARDLVNGKFVAVKKVRFDYLNPASVRFMAREIVLLRRLDHPNVIKLEGLITSRTSSSLYLVFEYMDRDLHPTPRNNFSEAQVKCYMQQLLSGLDYCHSHGVLHRDLKGSNLLVDKNGILKIADFGLANFYDHSSSLPQTRGMVSLRYRPPEILLGASKYGVGVDLWSAGCILGELYYGDNILPGTSELEQLHRIYRLCGSPSDDDCWRRLHLGSSSTAVTQRPNPPHRRRVAEIFKDLVPPAALQLMEILLSLDPADRGTAAMALNTDFFLQPPQGLCWSASTDRRS